MKFKTFETREQAKMEINKPWFKTVKTPQGFIILEIGTDKTGLLENGTWGKGDL